MKHMPRLLPLAAAIALWLGVSLPAFAQRSSIPAPTRSTPGGPAAFAGAEADKKPMPEPPIVDKEYRLGPGDKLRIEVYRDQQLSQSVQIRPDGKITLPLVGDMEAAGRTPLELRDQIGTSLKEYITNPVVTVIVVEAMPQTISVIGEVNSPGTHPIKGETTVIEALALAGGFKDFANTKNITIQRATPTGVKRIPFNYKDAIKSEGKPMCVEPGDVIIVP
jgi:polysaccharide export outer membrane protein